jgi:hypothetical protein
VAIRFGSSSRVKNRLPKYSNFWDGTAVYSPFSPTGSYDALATYTVPSGGISSVDFTGIPNTYTHLQIRGIARATAGSGGLNYGIQFNGDTGNNYAVHYLAGDGSSAFTDYATSLSVPYVYNVPSSSVTANVFSAVVIDILDYANANKYHTIRSLSGYDGNGSGAVRLNSGLHMSTTPVTSIKLRPYGSNPSFAEFSQFALYGVKG